METHRKIELQADEDLAFLVANVRRAATARLDEAFPPVDDGGEDGGAAGGGEDELRTRIEQLVDEYITKTFTLASPNLSINGMDVDAGRLLSTSSSSNNKNGHREEDRGPEVVYEAFDGRKRERVEDLAREEEDLLRDIAALKKGVPSAAAAAWAEAARRSLLDDEEALRLCSEGLEAAAAGAGVGGGGDGQVTASSDVPRIPGVAADDDDEDDDDDDEEGDDDNDNDNDGGDDDNDDEAGGEGKSKSKSKKKSKAGKTSTSTTAVAPLERQADVEAGYAGAVRGLARLRREMPAVVARMERARTAGDYVVHGR